MFILIAPSPAVQDGMSRLLKQDVSGGCKMVPLFALHKALIEDSLKGWLDYMGWLEEESKEKCNRTLLSDTDGEDKSSRPIYFTAGDRQYLKKLDDNITDLLVILRTTVDTIVHISGRYRSCCKMNCGKRSRQCQDIVEEFAQYAKEAQMYLERARVLQARVHSTAQLVVLKMFRRFQHKITY